MDQPRGIIIAGGESRRMGTDKALLPLQGRPLLAHVAEQLLTLCTRIDIASGTAARAERYKSALGMAGVDAGWAVAPDAGQSDRTAKRPIRFVTDRFAGAGPLAGLHAALSEPPLASRAAGSDQAESFPYALVMACDMPRVSMPLLSRMLEQARVTEADVICVPGQPFHALYHVRTAAVIETMLLEGELRLMRLLSRVRTAAIEPAAAEVEVFVPLNTPEAYQTYLDQVAKRLND